MDNELLREQLRKVIKDVIQEGVIDPYLIISGIATDLHSVRRQIEDIVNSNIIPDEEAMTEIKTAYEHIKKSFEIMNKLILRYQNMGLRDDK